MKMCLVMILVKKVFIFSKTMIICLLCPLLCGLFFFWKGAKGELSYKAKKEIQISYTGNGFLHNMVRILTGTLVEVGCGKIKPEDITKALESTKRSDAGITAPPQGLFLVSVEY